MDNGVCFGILLLPCNPLFFSMCNMDRRLEVQHPHCNREAENSLRIEGTQVHAELFYQSKIPELQIPCYMRQNKPLTYLNHN